MRKGLLVLLALFVIVGIPLAKKYLSSDAAKPVEVDLVSLHSIKASFLASGQFKHENAIVLSAEVIGKVQKLYVVEGQYVEKGQRLLDLDDQAYRAALEQQQAVVNQQRTSIQKQKLLVDNLARQWQRKELLFRKKLLDNDAFDLITNQYQLAKLDLQSTQQQLAQAQASLDQARDRLSKTQINSPIDGTITSLDIKQGETAIPGSTNLVASALMTIADPKSMLVEIQVDETDIAKVKVGQSAQIAAIAFPEQTLTGEIESIASSAKQALGHSNLSFAVKLHLKNLSTDIASQLRPGMSCRAEVFTQSDHEILSVPVKAILTREDNEKSLVENYILIANQGKAKRLTVTTGISDDNYQEIIDGVESGSQVIVGPNKILRHLKDGDTIAISTGEAI